MQIGKVEIYMGPRQLGAPDDLEAAIVKFIDGAEKRLEVAVQELDNETIAKALIRARQRKCLVKIVLEGSYLSVDRARAKPFLPMLLIALRNPGTTPSSRLRWRPA